MPFDIGKHRELSDIDERDLMAIPLDLDMSLPSFDSVANEVLAALSSLEDYSGDPEMTHMIDRILENAQPRMAVLQRFL